MHWIVGLLCWVAVALTLTFAVCRFLGLWSQTASWFRSTKEEKCNLTKSGIYNANGLLIKTDSDDYGGDNFHRFELVDSEYPMTTMAYFPINKESSIPPQPLRPAPNIIPLESKLSNKSSVTDLVKSCEEGKFEKFDSFYHYNISTAVTQSYISKESKNDEQSTSLNSTIYNSQKLDEIITLENEVDDLTTINNLNIFKKPEYTNTNPFLSNNCKLNEQFNPFCKEPWKQNDLSEVLKDKRQYDELSNECDNQRDIRLHQENKMAVLLRKKSFDDENEESSSTVISSGIVKRAISCDSVSSDTSLGPFEIPSPIITGQLCLSLRCFKINSTESLLAVNVIEARNLQGDNPDTYVAIFLLPEHKGDHFKTKICRSTNCPSYNETFLVDIGKINKKLCFHIYNTENDACLLIGEAELSLQDANSYKQPVTTWLTLTDCGQESVEFGELMLSLSYLPTAERLTLILTRARRLPDPNNFNIFVKVYIQKSGKKIVKKRSSIKRSEINPTFNEAFIFSIPPSMLSSIEIRVTLFYFPIGVDYLDINQHKKIGHVLLCHDAYGKPGNHWNQMIASLRKPVSMWHALRRSHK